MFGVADETEEPDEPWLVGRAAPLPLIGPVPDEVRITLAQQVYIPIEADAFSLDEDPGPGAFEIRWALGSHSGEPDRCAYWHD